MGHSPVELRSNEREKDNSAAAVAVFGVAGRRCPGQHGAGIGGQGWAARRSAGLARGGGRGGRGGGGGGRGGCEGGGGRRRRGAPPAVGGGPGRAPGGGAPPAGQGRGPGS